MLCMARRNDPNKPRPARRPRGTLPSLVAATLHTPALTKLPPREQEIATIVYLHTDVTARELEVALSNEITNSAIRCMLSRLVRKGLVRRRKGQGKTFIYSPALLLPDIQERALERLADDYFDGSLYQATLRLMALIERHEPEALTALNHHILSASAPPGRAGEAYRTAG